MNRSFTAVGMVQLPRLSVTDAIALGTAMVTRSKSVKGPLPVPIRKALRWVQGSLKVLSNAATSRLRLAAEDSPVALDAKRVVEAAWGAAYGWCRGLARLPDAPEISAPATRLLDALFADGMRFNQMRSQLHWAESQVRLDLIVEDALDEVFAELGGQPILDSIRRAHERYGEVLGITEVQCQEDEVPVGTRLREFLDDLRCYVVRVVAHVDRDDQSTQELSDYLLVPLRTWKSASTGSDDVPEDPEFPEFPEVVDVEAAEIGALDAVAPAGLLSSPAIPVPFDSDDPST